MRPLIRIAWCGAIATLALSTGCSDKQSLSEKYPTQWNTCNALFGAKNMESLRDILDSDDLKFTNGTLSVDQLKKGLTEEALKPYDRAQGFDEYDVCRILGNGLFSTNVAWAAASLKEVQSSSGGWHRAATDVYVADPSRVGGDIDLVFRCEIKGASSGQQAQVLLEARVNPPDSPKFSEEFHQQLTVSLARALTNELACTNAPEIPNDLSIGK